MMAAFILYLLKVSAYLLAWYLPFTLFLKRTTFFKLNRIYLVLGIVLSFLFPLHRGFNSTFTTVPVSLPSFEPYFEQLETGLTPPVEGTKTIDWLAVLFVIYGLGVTIRAYRLILAFVQVFKLKGSVKPYFYKDLTVFEVLTPVPFSFFRCIYLPAGLSDSTILAHEAAHIRQHHWVDLVLTEFAAIALWFNPIFIFYKRAVQQQHEYLADKATVDSGVPTVQYLRSMQHQIQLGIAPPLTSTFYFQSIKNRIQMLTKKSTSAIALAAYTLAVPLFIGLLMAFSSQKNFNVSGFQASDPAPQDISFGNPIAKESNAELASGYGERMHPVLKVVRRHTGVDFRAAEGTPVLASQNGVVVKAKLEGAWGNIIVMQHEGSYTTSYAHLKTFNVKKGDKILKGEKIGVVGHTGLAVNDHLHFELLKQGKSIDPLLYLPKQE